jgi:hypothetical protein
MGNPPTCFVAGVPTSQLEGVHDVAVFDIDGDGWQDLVLGRCTGTSIYRNVPPAPAGSVPASAVPGSEPLMVAKEPFGRVTLGWGESCATSDDDYAVYAGTLGDFTSHEQRKCSTDGARTHTMLAGDATYFLVVPRSASREGSYGQDSRGLERPPSSEPCLTQLIEACE